MNEEEILIRVKTQMNMQDNDYQDETIKGWISIVKEFMLGAGVPQEVIDSDRSIGAITLGVIDLWDFGSGTGTLSQRFQWFLNQLRVGE